MEKEFISPVDKVENVRDIFDVISGHFPSIDIDLLMIVTGAETPINIDTQIFDDGYKYTINLSAKGLNYDKYYPAVHKRLFEFIENVGYEINAYSRTVMMLLHEFGHAYKSETMFAFCQERFHNILTYAEGFMLDNVDFLKMVVQTIDTDGIDLKYMMSAEECFADGFAMKHFVPVYKKLIASNLVNQ